MSDLHDRLRELGYWMEAREKLVREALEAGLPIRAIAAESGLSYGTVWRWRAKWREERNLSQVAGLK